MAKRIPPHSESAERSLLGALLMSTSALDVVVESGLDPSDFYLPALSAAFASILALRAEGVGTNDPVAVAQRMNEDGSLSLLDPLGGPWALAEMARDCPSIGNVGAYAQTIAESALRRRLASAMAEVAEMSYDPSTPPHRLLEAAQGAVSNIELPGVRLPESLATLDDYLAMHTESSPWVIPGMIRQGWRLIVVGGEGTGKTWLTNQIAVAAGQGVHPLFPDKHRPLSPVSTLIIDLENPVDHVAMRGRAMVEPLRTYAGSNYDAERCHVWTRRNGLNLRNRSQRAELEAVLRKTRPALVVIGPLRKLAHRTGNEDLELAALATTEILDDLIDRYDFGLIIEHHAPKALRSEVDMVPFGSNVWQSWPEMGITLHKCDPNADNAPATSLKLGRFRGDRMPSAWPSRVDRNPHGLPWVGYWPEGVGIDELPS